MSVLHLMTATDSQTASGYLSGIHSGSVSETVKGQRRESEFAMALQLVSAIVTQKMAGKATESSWGLETNSELWLDYSSQCY